MVRHNNSAAAEELLRSLKGIAAARVDCDAHGRITKVCIEPAGIDDRAALRNAQSALFAVFGQNIDVNDMIIGIQQHGASAGAGAAEAQDGVVELFGRRSELNDAARVAFDTLRTAQSTFHSFLFDGAELVKIAGQQYVVVAVRRASTEARYCGAAPVLDSVSTASARALMNAVGVAAMGAHSFELQVADERTA